MSSPAAVIRNLSWNTTTALGIVALQLSTTMVLARYITPNDFGTVGLATIVLGFGIALAQLGLTQALVHQPRLDNADIWTAIAISILSGAAWAGGCWFIAAVLHPTDAPSVERTIAVLSPCIAVRAVGCVPEGILVRSSRFDLLAATELASYATGYVIVGIPIAIAGGGGSALVVAYASACVVRTVALLILAPLRMPMRVDLRSTRLLRFGIGQTIAQTANSVATESDNLIVGAALGPAALGAYGKAYQLAVAPANSVSTVIDRAIYPLLVRLRDSDYESFKQTYCSAIALAVALLLPIAALACAAAPEVVRIVLGPNWDAAVLPLRILSIGLVFRGAFQLSDCFCRALGVVYKSGIRQIVYAGGVASGALAGTHFGISGVAVGVVSAMCLKYLMMTQLSLAAFRIPSRDYILALRKESVSAAVLSAAVVAVVTTARLYGLPPGLVCAVAACVGGVAIARAALKSRPLIRSIEINELAI